MTPELKYKTERCAALLAESPLDAEIKKTILDNLSSMTEGDLDNILHSLERETLELTAFAKDLEKFDANQEQRWISVEKDQQKLAEKALEDALNSVKPQA